MKFKIRRDSKKEPEKFTKVFGEPISSEIPHIVSIGMEILQEKYLFAEGLFRMSGDNNAMQEMRRQFDEGMYKTEEEVRALLNRHKEHTIAGMVKMWFRELPDPLLTFDHYDMFLAAHGKCNGVS